MEQWKDVKGYEGMYQVSNFGRVRSIGVLRRNFKGQVVFINRERILSPFDNGNGYLAVSFQHNHIRKNFYVHRLVAETFIDNPDSKPQVNHKDYNRKNNHVSNLEWMTAHENFGYSKCNIPKRQNYSTNTGERYITKRPNRNLYRVSAVICGKEKSFSTLEKAIEYRNKVLDEINLAI